MDDIKQFLYAWLGKQRLTPNYEIIPINSRNKQRFKCELRVDGINYLGAGNSTNKKDAQANAALDFCQYLVRMGRLNQSDLPKLGPKEGENVDADNSYNSLPRGLVAPHQSMGLSFNEESHSSSNYLPYDRNNVPASYWEHLNNLKNRKMVQEAEDTDVNAEIHGFWTIENSKSRLHQYLQANKIKTDYRYSATGPDNNRFQQNK